MTPGRRAYEAYCVSSSGRSLVSGAALPPWEGQSPGIRDAWEAAASAVLAAPAPEDALSAPVPTGVVPVDPRGGEGQQGGAGDREALVERLAEVVQTVLREVSGLRCNLCRGSGVITVECADGQCMNKAHITQAECPRDAHRTIEQQDAVDTINAVLDLLEAEGRLRDPFDWGVRIPGANHQDVQICRGEAEARAIVKDGLRYGITLTRRVPGSEWEEVPDA